MRKKVEYFDGKRTYEFEVDFNNHSIHYMFGGESIMESYHENIDEEHWKEDWYRDFICSEFADRIYLESLALKNTFRIEDYI